MPSIKSISYKLPLVEPLRKNGRLSTGANTPLLITGIDIKTGEKDDYVVKLMKASRMSVAASMRELLAAFIAMELDIPVIDPVIVNITPAFSDLLIGDEDHVLVSQSLGYNFGSKYVANYQTIPRNQQLPQTLTSFALDVFAFDLLTQNSDRTAEKPNMITNGKEIVVLDHEIAFGFVLDLPFARNKTPWIMRESERQWAAKHCLYNTVKGEIFDRESFRERLLRLDDAFWRRSWELVPDSWKGTEQKEQFQTIQSYLSQIVLNADEFISNIQQILV